MNQKGSSLIIVFVLILIAAGTAYVWLHPSQDGVLTGSTESSVATHTADPLISDEVSQALEVMKKAEKNAGFAATFAPDEKLWVVSEGHRLEKFSLGPGAVFARLSSAVPFEKSKVIDGLYAELPVEFAQSANGRRVQIGIVARGSQSNPSSTFSALYATQQTGNSGWKSIVAGDTFGLRTFEFDVPKQPEGYSSKPVIAIRGDEEGKSLGVEIIGVYAKVLPPPAFVVDFATQVAEWIVPEGHNLTATQSANGLVLGRLVSKRPLKVSDTNLGAQGAAVQIPLATVQKFSGKKIEIAVSARSSATSPSAKLWLMYATQQSGNSGWREISLSPELKTYRLEYDFPAVAEGITQPSIIVLHPDNSGAGLAVDIRSIEVDLVQ